MAKHGLSLYGIETHVIGPTGYLTTITVSYPLPPRISYPVPAELGTVDTFMAFTELWIEYVGKNTVLPFAVYDVRDRSPAAHLKVDH